MSCDCVMWWISTLVTMLTTIILYENVKVFKYYARWLIFLIGSGMTASMFIPLMLIKPRDWRNALLPAWGARTIAKLLGLRYQVKGHENIVKDEGAVVLINHQSFLDLIVLAELWPVVERSTVISKKEIFYLWPFGLASWLWGTVFIDRKSSKDAQASVNAAAETITSKKSRILMFPEGSRWGGAELRPFKKGAFHIAIESQAPLQPVVVRRYTFLDHKNFRFDRGSCMINILPAIPTKGLKKEDMDKLMSQAHEEMQKEYERLNSE